MRDVLIVTGADAAYFPLLAELVASIEAACVGDMPKLAVIDGGLTPEQANALSMRGVMVRDFPEATPDMARHLVKRPALAVNFAKLRLDQLFKDASTIICLDADTWVQDAAALRMLRDAAASGALAIVGSGGRNRTQLVTIRWLFGMFPQVRSFYMKNARHAGIPWAMRRRIAVATELNAGVFALRRDAPHWERLRYWQDRILRQGKPFTADQLALGLVCHGEGLPVELLPETCNYFGEFRIDPAQRMLLERYHPHAPVGIVHMPGHKKVRFDPEATVPVQGLDGRSYAVSLRHGHFTRSLLRQLEAAVP